VVLVVCSFLCVFGVSLCHHFLMTELWQIRGARSRCSALQSEIVVFQKTEIPNLTEHILEACAALLIQCKWKEKHARWNNHLDAPARELHTFRAMLAFHAVRTQYYQQNKKLKSRSWLVRKFQIYRKGIVTYAAMLLIILCICLVGGITVLDRGIVLDFAKNAQKVLLSVSSERIISSTNEHMTVGPFATNLVLDRNKRVPLVPGNRSDRYLFYLLT
jgi:hypothetical protein